MNSKMILSLMIVNRLDMRGQADLAPVLCCVPSEKIGYEVTIERAEMKVL